MKLALLGGALGVWGTCNQEAAAGITDPNFSWLLTGSTVDRRNNVSAICASDSNPARTAFNNRLNQFTAACVPAGVEGQSSAIGLTVSLLTNVLCESKAQVGGDADYCLLSVLPLFDLNYFVTLAQGGTFAPPSLQPVGDDADRQTALCHSSVCNAWIENMASSLLARVPDSSNSVLGSDFIRRTVSRMRCGCAVSNIACESTEIMNQLITTGDTGEPSFVNGQACDANGVLSACARTWVNCESVPLPACARTCKGEVIATIKFALKSLSWECAQTQLTTATLPTIRADVIANVAGLLDTDFNCTCDAAVAPKNGTECTCTVTCAALAVVKNLNLTYSLALLSKHASAFVIPTPNIDQTVSPNCKITQDDQSFGSSFELQSVTTNFPKSPAPTTATAIDASASSALNVGLVVLASFLINFVL